MLLGDDAAALMGQGDEPSLLVGDHRFDSRIRRGCGYFYALDKVVDPLPRLRRHEHVVLMARFKAAAVVGVEQVYLVEDPDAGDVVRMDLVENLLHCE